jgi:hypothetical protein
VVLAELARLEKAFGADNIVEVYELLSNQYYFAFFFIVMQVLLPMVWTNPNLRLEVIYDLNIHERPKLNLGYQGLTEHISEAQFLVGEPHGERDEDFAPLLAADLAAWHIHKDYVEQQHNRQHSDSVWRILQDGSIYPRQDIDLKRAIVDVLRRMEADQDKKHGG